MRKKKFSIDSKFTRNKPLPYINNMNNPQGIGKINTALIAGERYKADRFVDIAAGVQGIVDDVYDREVKLYEMAGADHGDKSATKKDDGGGQQTQKSMYSTEDIAGTKDKEIELNSDQWSMWDNM